MRIRKIGKTKTDSTEYVVLNNMNMIVATFTKAEIIYKIHFIDNCPSVVKEVMEVIYND